ncbi:hypothetical protein SODALDRAFT_362667 [Sodiomyces alkalinus F11]|uniref:Uncharacterized protein n=1 Tax=Sodiomyces alkalinus (strain CBS 110278 / VKM F-3762 / F11) TaxID=1314773 RepID=A0A3N2PMS2_SODAK|nr:hypothetical protein SODALDRAFT_362667 [Sodiomyces alkalinus F11]ROT35823.1 hypothetical protein SODALDRAFT_362667 [Sodiomyces alkalinus F11]
MSPTTHPPTPRSTSDTRGLLPITCTSQYGWRRRVKEGKGREGNRYGYGYGYGYGRAGVKYEVDDMMETCDERCHWTPKMLRNKPDWQICLPVAPVPTNWTAAGPSSTSYNSMPGPPCIKPYSSYDTQSARTICRGPRQNPPPVPAGYPHGYIGYILNTQVRRHYINRLHRTHPDKLLATQVSSRSDHQAGNKFPKSGAPCIVNRSLHSLPVLQLRGWSVGVLLLVARLDMCW